MTPTKEKLYKLNKLESQQLRREEYLINELLQTVYTLPISKATKTMVERKLYNSPKCHSLLARDTPQDLIDWILKLSPETDEEYNNGVTLYIYRSVLWDMIQSMAGKKIFGILGPRLKKEGLPAEGYTVLNANTDEKSILLNCESWWKEKVKALSTLGLTNHTKRNIRFYLVVILACTKNKCLMRIPTRKAFNSIASRGYGV